MHAQTIITKKHGNAPMVRVLAVLPEKLQSTNTAESPETIVSPAEVEDPPSNEFKLHR
jgi:hypothetical protein